jgi:hypothetical protein
MKKERKKTESDSIKEKNALKPNLAKKNTHSISVITLHKKR